MEEENKKPSEAKDVKPSPIANLLKDMPEWLAPLLSGLGSMGGSYMLFIKPMQERMDVLSSQVIDLRDEVKELKRQNKGLEKDMEEMHGNQSNDLNGYLPIKKTSSQGSYAKKRV